MTCTLKVFIVFEKDNELLDNPEYVTFQHMDEFEYRSEPSTYYIYSKAQK